MLTPRWLPAFSSTILFAGLTPAQTIAPTNKTVEHARKDEDSLRKIGKDSIDAGLNAYGALGFELFAVTSIPDTGAAGFHYLKRQPWTAETPRPAFEYKRLDSGEIEKLGAGEFGAGLAVLEQDNWELVALTTNAKGAVGFHYFKRAKK